MKRKLLVFLCAVVLLLASVPAAFARELTGAPVPAVASKGNVNAEWENYLVENKANLKFYLMGNCAYLADGSNTNSIWNIYFDTTEKLTAKSNQSWLTVKKVGNNVVFNFDNNPQTSNRTAKVTVTAKGYKATLTFTQLGKDSITSAKRSKKTVTLKLKKGKASLHYLSIYESWTTEEDGETYETNRTVFSGLCDKSTYKFKVKKGHNYSVSYGPAVELSSAGWTPYDGTSGVWFIVESVTGSEVYTPYNN